jgi:2-iminoacetate synthase
MKLPSLDLSTNAGDFIDAAHIESLLTRPPADAARVRDIIAKSLARNSLSVEETAVLLTTRDRGVIEEIYAGARRLKEAVYGNRIVLFAPLYIGNDCVNDCLYCAFRRSNHEQVRMTLDLDTVTRQVIALEEEGHKRLILVFGEHPRYDADFIHDCVERIYSVRTGKGEIRRVNINAAPQDIAGYKRIKSAGIGTYQVFQETYHKATYADYHGTTSRKANYLYRLDALDRAQEAGIDDVGIGALFGLYDWRFEVLGLVTHALHMQQKFGVGPHTISFPRVQPAQGVTLPDTWLVGDEDFKRVVATLRLAVPYTGMILTARESADLRRELLAFGVSQIDAGTRLELGGYTQRDDHQHLELEQFQLGDERSLDEVMRELIIDGYLPSFCTACYRLGRTGEHFMEFAIPGFIKRFCTPNGLTTVMEYLCDYASPETRNAGLRLIEKEIAAMPDENLKREVQKRLETIRTTEKRDLYF